MKSVVSNDLEEEEEESSSTSTDSDDDLTSQDNKPPEREDFAKRFRRIKAKLALLSLKKSKKKEKERARTPLEIIKQRYPASIFGGMDIEKIKTWNTFGYFDEQYFFLYKNVVTLPKGCIFGELGLNSN